MSLDLYNRKAQEKDDHDDLKKKNVQDICSLQTRCYAFGIHDITQSLKPVVPNLFGTRDWFC